MIDDDGDDLTDEEREALHAAIRKSAEEADAGEARPASEILRDLRHRP